MKTDIRWTGCADQSIAAAPPGKNICPDGSFRMFQCFQYFPYGIGVQILVSTWQFLISKVPAAKLLQCQTGFDHAKSGQWMIRSIFFYDISISTNDFHKIWVLFLFHIKTILKMISIALYRKTSFLARNTSEV